MNSLAFTRTRRAIALASSLVAAAPAFADSSASASLQNLSITYGAISTVDGAAAPWIYAYPSSPNYASSAQIAEQTIDQTTGNVTEDVESNQYGTHLFQAGSVSGASAYAFGSATVSGDPYAGTGLAATQAYAIGATGEFVYSSSSASPDGGEMTFLLGPNTFLNVSGTAKLSLSAGGDSYDAATAMAYVDGNLYDSDNPWGTQTGAMAEIDTGSGNSQALTQDLNLTFVGSLTDMTYVEFDSGAYASAQAVVDVPIPTIPEPPTAALLLAGIGALGFIARRRTNV